MLNILRETAHQAVNVVAKIKGKFYPYRSQFGLKAKCVCRKCNQEWMSQLESSAQHVIGPLIQDFSIPLSSDLQITAALWCLKMAMVTEFVTRSSHPPFYSQDEREGFRSHFIFGLHSRICG
jgi:hypothetical protein